MLGALPAKALPDSITMNATEPKNVLRPAGWHSRGYLPHYDGGEVPQFITFRLGDSLPERTAGSAGVRGPQRGSPAGVLIPPAVSA